MAHRLEITLSDVTLARLDAACARADAGPPTQRATFVKWALEKALSDGPGPFFTEGKVSSLSAPSRASVSKLDATSPDPSSGRGKVSPAVLPASPHFYCPKGCGFSALSERARCPRHPGKLVAG